VNPRGIPIAQIESNLEGDPKLVRLSRSLGCEPYYAAMGVYLSIVLRAWATGTRDVDSNLMDLFPDNAVDNLKGVGLLDDAGAIPADVFDAWPGRVARELADRQDRFTELAAAGGRARARGPRDAAGRLLPKTSNEPAEPSRPPAVLLDGVQPGSSRTAGGSSLDKTREDESVTTSLRSVAAGAASRTDRDWVAFVVEPDPECRIGATGRKLPVQAERVARFGDFYESRFGRPMPDRQGSRVAKAIEAHPGGAPGLMADLSEAALKGVAGDPIDYIAGKLRRTHGASQSTGHQVSAAEAERAFGG
jgi:hypothetical protein